MDNCEKGCIKSHVKICSDGHPWYIEFVNETSHNYDIYYNNFMSITENKSYLHDLMVWCEAKYKDFIAKPNIFDKKKMKSGRFRTYKTYNITSR